MSTSSPRIYRFIPWFIRTLIPPMFIGSYILYGIGTEGARPIYVGRSDTDLQRRLCTHPLLGVALYFEYDVYGTPEKAFIMECTLYHIFQGSVLNKIHPAQPPGSDVICPYCESMWKTLNRRITII